MKKIISIIMIMLLVGTAIPSEAQFGGPVTEIGPNLANSTRDVLGQFVLKKIPLKIAKKILDKMTDSVVVWAAGGFKKEGPAFVSNFGDLAKASAISAGTVLIDELVAEGESQAISGLTAAEQAELKKCRDNEKEYNYYYNLIRTGLLDAGIGIGYGKTLSLKSDGPAVFNDYLTHRGYSAYVQNPGVPPNEAALKEFIENGIMLNPQALADSGIKSDVNVLEGYIKKQDECAKTLFLKVAGLNYTSQLVSFIGSTYRAGREGTASRIGIPDFENLGRDYKKSLSENWKSFQNDASYGNIDSFYESSKLENTPWGAKYLAQAELNNHLATELADKTAQLQRSGGFLDKGECREWKQGNASGGTEQVCIDYQANTPGATIKEAINKKVLQQYDQLNNVEEWGDMLLTTGIKLVSGVLTEGVIPLAQSELNNTIDRGLSCLAGECDDSAFGQTTVASSQTITNSGGGLDDVVDIRSVLYGQLVLNKDSNGDVVYERSDALGNRIRLKLDKYGQAIEYIAYAVRDYPDKQFPESAYPQLKGLKALEGEILYRIKIDKQTKQESVPTQVTDSSGNTSTIYKNVTTEKIVYLPTLMSNGLRMFNDSVSLDVDAPIDYSRPQYAIETQSNSDVLKYDVDKSGKFILDANGKRTPKYVRNNGSIQLAEELQTLLNAQNIFIRQSGIRKLMELDHALPGPDLGWDERLNDKALEKISEKTGKEKTAFRELFDNVKRKFEAGYLGQIKDDPFDIALVRASDSVVFANPQFSFADFRYPVQGLDTTLEITSLGEPLPNPKVNKSNYQSFIDATFPNVLSLKEGNDTVSDNYSVVSMNTHAGWWFNPSTEQIESVGNIPEADEMRELTLAMQSLFSNSSDLSKRRGTEIRLVLQKLNDLKKRYEELPYVNPTTALEERVERKRLEDEIAYEISLIREKLPIYDEVQEVKNSIKSILVLYDKVSELIEGTKEYRSKKNYASRFGDLQQYRGTDTLQENYEGLSRYEEDPVEQERYTTLMLKDRMNILFCGLQDHSIINHLPLATKKQYLKLLPRGDESGGASLGSIVPFGGIGQSISGGGLNLYSPYFGEEIAVRPFNGIPVAYYKWKFLKSRVNDTYGFRVPYRCYESSVICGGDTPCASSSWECPLKGHETPDESFLMVGTPTTCKSVYRSSLGDYLDLIDSES